MDPDELERMVRQVEAAIAAAWLAALAGIRNARTVAALAELLGSGRIEEAMETFGPNISRLNQAWNEAVVRAGTTTAAKNTAALGRGEIVMQFDMVNDRALRMMQENNLRLVREFSQQQRRATQQALLDGIGQGENPVALARRFRGSIGLTQRQAAAVNNFEQMLRTGDRAALTRALRDRRFDGTIRRAIANRTPLTEKQISTMVGRYRERSLKKRSQTIARTEALRAVHSGQHAAMQQAVDAGHISADMIVREWNTAADERVRSLASTRGQTSHQSMHGQMVRGLETPFMSGAGNALLYPTDGSAPAYDTIACRCVASERLDLSFSDSVTSITVFDEL